MCQFFHTDFDGTFVKCKKCSMAFFRIGQNEFQSNIKSGVCINLASLIGQNTKINDFSRRETL